jgi:hypothetical protein
MPKIKKYTPALKGDFLIFRAPFRVRGNPKNQIELNLNSFFVIGKHHRPTTND